MESNKWLIIGSFFLNFLGYFINLFCLWALVMMAFDDFDVDEERRLERGSLKEIVIFSVANLDGGDFLGMTFAVAIAAGLFDGLICGWRFALRSGYLAGSIFILIAPVAITLARRSGLFKREGNDNENNK